MDTKRWVNIEDTEIDREKGKHYRNSWWGEGSCEKEGGDSKRRTSSLQLVKELA
jgi:hypothetical protein